MLQAGEPPDRADAAMVLVHGRGAGAADILSLAAELDRGRFTYVAPQAAGATWYPHSFLAAFERNEPGLSSGLAVLAELVAGLAAAGLPPERTMLLGFSQGACLTLEFAARNARRYGGLVGLSGGLVGPPGSPRDYAGSLAGTPVFLGCSERDPHIPAERVLETVRVLRHLGGDVADRLYAHLGHTVNADELSHVRAMMDELLEGGSRSRLEEPPPPLRAPRESGG